MTAQILLTSKLYEIEQKTFFLQFRLAHLEDADWLLELRNDPVTRLNSRNHSAISPQEHAQWFESLLADINNSSLLYIAELKSLGNDSSIKLGSIRLDKKGGDLSELSYIVAPLHRGKGWGKEIVCQFVAKLELKGRFVLFIQRGNTASESIARALDLSPVTETETALDEPQKKFSIIKWC